MGNPRSAAEKRTFLSRIEQYPPFRAVRSGLTRMIPVLIVGAFALVLKTFPVDAYQTFIQTFANGFLVNLFNIINTATFGVLSVYMTYAVSRAYMRIKADEDIVSGGAVAASLICFFILAGVDLESFGTDSIGPKSVFLAILTGLICSWLYRTISMPFFRKQKEVYSQGADREYNRTLPTLVPIAVVVLIFAVFNELVTALTGTDSFRTLVHQAFNALFSIGETGFFKGLFFVLLSSVLWFFGIHGSDTLEDVMQNQFATGLAANQQALAAGGQPTAILTKEFFDCFVLMGGCGATICLLIAILIRTRSRARRGLALTATFPMLFNINELMVFGLPIVFNPIMLIPFLAVPLVCYSVTYLAMSAGWVPLISNEVAWTTPVLLGGYSATGSLAGSALQLVNIVLGVSIYLPFVRMLDKHQEATVRADFERFMAFFRENEDHISGARLVDRTDFYGDFTKGLCADLRYGLKKNLRLAYQPQYRYDGTCIGAETLLRWKHPVYGLLYPPLVVHLAEECGMLPELEETVLEKAIAERPKVLERFGPEIKLSVNVTGTTIVTPRFMQFCRQLNEKEPFAGRNLCLELTEQAAFKFDDQTRQILRDLREMDLMLEIDDFSMGQTSIHYLKEGLFDVVKLDGSLVRGLFAFDHSREIVASITQLAASLDMDVLAEFVETEEQKEALHELGCDLYQGYLYSPAVFLDDIEKAEK